MLIPFGLLEKMEIRSFSKPEMLPTDEKGKMKVLINPEGYNQEYNIEYNSEQAEGSSKTQLTYSRSTNQEMSFDFLFDRTGALPLSFPLPTGVTTDIEELKKLVYEFDGDIHKPPYLKLTWGSLTFPCVLKTLNVQYKLFQSNGYPLRAVVSATFLEFKDQELIQAEEGKESPDLTKIHEVLEGETLPLLAHRIYGDASYYLEVARINKLVNFKTLSAGQKLVFPPLEK